MADDDGGDWLAGGDDEGGDDWLSGAAEDTSSSTAAASGGGGGAAAGDGDAAAKPRVDEWAWPKGQPFLPLPPYRTRRVQPRKLDKFIPFTHWSRPTSLAYEYIYLYRKNYYDDVIDYLDKRTRGIEREIPRPQTWAERALRTYTSPSPPPRMQKTVIVEDSLKNVGTVAGLTHTNAIRHHLSNNVVRTRYYDALYQPLPGPQAPADE
ncbi:Flightin [Frankliniella fusca]|uniref:Flightin n=1 Tax=Frankliniella fusca TaxID=407009 RepID=A0AAE1GRV0_9NEOP|nr:Flightin [Frankliniella fusca]